MINILDRLLYPLAKIMIAKGVLFPQTAERLKSNFVKAAIDTAPSKPTDSWISQATGLQRRDIKRLRNPQKQTENHPNHLARLVSVWMTHPAFSQDGTPRILARNGGQNSFEDLAKSVRQDIHPHTQLLALQTAGTVSINDKTNEVELIERSYQPLAGSTEAFDYLAANVGDHLSAATSNTLASKSSFFERAVHFNRLTPENVKELQAVFETEQQAVLERLNALAVKLQGNNINQPNATERFRAGGYLFFEKDNPK